MKRKKIQQQLVKEERMETKKGKIGRKKKLKFQYI